MEGGEGQTCSKHTQTREKKSIAETKTHFGRQSPCEVPESQFQLPVAGLWQELLESGQPGFGFTAAAKPAHRVKAVKGHKSNRSFRELKLASAQGLGISHGDSEQGRTGWPRVLEKPLLVPGMWMAGKLKNVWNRSLNGCCQLHPCLPALLGVGGLEMVCWDRRQG